MHIVIYAKSELFGREFEMSVGYRKYICLLNYDVYFRVFDTLECNEEWEMCSFNIDQAITNPTSKIVNR